MKKAFTFSVALAGFTATASQIVLVREFLTVFYGNELSVGFIFASWLIAGAAGSFVIGGAADRMSTPAAPFLSCQMAVAAMLPASLVAVRSVKSVLGITTGSIVPFFPMAISSFAILLPMCACLGFMFSLACRIYETERAEAAKGIGNVYVLESAGAIVGGALTSFILIRLLDPVDIMGILCALNLASAAWLGSSYRDKKFGKFFSSCAAALFLAGILMWPLKGWAAVRSYSMNNLWCGYELLASRNSIYGNVAVAKTGEELSFFDNGLHLYTVPDTETQEEAVHFALLEHPHPESVLLVGGGAGGAMDETAKHPVKKIDYVELDPLIIQLAQDHLPQRYRRALRDARAFVKNTDGRLFVNTTTEKYDCVIVNIGDPYTAQLDRFYTEEFFKEARRILKRGGVLSFALSSSENYINDELRRFLKTVHATLKKVFPDVKVIPGNTAYFLASDGTVPLTYDYRVLMERAGARSLDVKYVREYYLFSKLSPERTAYLEGVLTSGAHGEINRDFRPLGYYYYTLFWMSHFKDSVLKKMLKAVTEKKIWFGIAAIILLVLVGGSLYARPTVLAIAMTGFSSMALQMVMLLSFQMIYGYLFYKLGAILTAFMAGLALGGAAAVGVTGLAAARRIFTLTQAGITAYAACLPAAFSWLASSRSAFTAWAGPNIIFMALPAIAALLVGFQFPLAGSIYLEGRAGAGRAGGTNYGSDLFGASLGALLTGTVLIPVLGIASTCLAAAAMNLAVTLLLLKRL